MRDHRLHKGPWVLLAALTLVRFAFGVQFQSVSAVGPEMIADLGLSYAWLGTLIGAYSMLGLLLSLPAGWLIAWLGGRRIVLGALCLMIVGGLLMAFTPGPGVAIAGRLISGAGAVLQMVALPTIIADGFTGTALSIAMGTLLVGYPFGVGVGFITLPLVGSWRVAMMTTAALAVVALVAAALAMAGTSGVSVTPRRDSRISARKVATVIAAGLVWGLSNAGFSVLLGFAPVFFVAHGMSDNFASALVSLTPFATVPMGPLGGWLLGRLPQPAQGIAAGIVVTSTAIALLTLNVAPAPLLIVAGLALGATAGPMVVLPTAVLPPEHRAIGMGLFWLVYYVPMTVLPAFAGLARDLSGNPAAPLTAAAIMTILALVALIAYVSARRPIMLAADGG